MVWQQSRAGTMFQCFKQEYSDKRVIIDCTELKIQIPASVDNRVVVIHITKNGFTAIMLITIIPSDFISVKSIVARGRKSDTQFTIETTKF